MTAFWRRTRDPSHHEAIKARLQAERDLEKTRAETAKYRDLARALIEIQRVNHLGENAARAIRGDRT